MFVIETDAPCKRCTRHHKYVTQNCDLVVFSDEMTARYVARTISGSIVRELEELPTDVSIVMFAHKDGRPDPTLPQTVSRL